MNATLTPTTTINEDTWTYVREFARRLAMHQLFSSRNPAADANVSTGFTPESLDAVIGNMVGRRVRDWVRSKIRRQRHEGPSVQECIEAGIPLRSRMRSPEEEAAARQERALLREVVDVYERRQPLKGRLVRARKLRDEASAAIGAREDMSENAVNTAVSRALREMRPIAHSALRARAAPVPMARSGGQRRLVVYDLTETCRNLLARAA